MDEGGRSGLPPRFLPLPMAVVDDALPSLTGSQLKLLLVVARQTLGFVDPATGARKAEDWLTHRQLMCRTGCASQAVSDAVDGLVKRGLIQVRGEAGEALDTPERRRRSRSRLLFRLHPELIDRAATGAGPRETGGDTPQSGKDTLKSGLRKPETTIETDNKSNVVVESENQSRNSQGVGDRSVNAPGMRTCGGRTRASGFRDEDVCKVHVASSRLIRAGAPRAMAEDAVARWAWHSGLRRWVRGSGGGAEEGPQAPS